MDRGRSILREEFERDETTQTGPGVPLDKAVDPGTQYAPEEAAEQLEHEERHPAARMEAGEHEISEHSMWPVVTAAGLFLIGIGFITTLVVTAVGTVIMMVAIVGWFREPWAT